MRRSSARSAARSRRWTPPRSRASRERRSAPRRAESEEWDAGHIPGAKHVPARVPASRAVEGIVGTDRSQRVIIYCASGQRSALAANTLQELLGYENVASMNGGITLWKDRGYDVEEPVSLSRSSASATRATCSCRRSGSRGLDEPLNAKVPPALAPAGFGSPISLYRRPRASGTLGVVDDDDVDLSNLQPGDPTTDPIGTPKVDSAEIAINGINPDVKVVKYADAPRRLQHHGDHRRLRRDRRRRRQLPDPVPAQ